MPHIHHDEQDTTVQNTVEEEQPVPETTTEDENTDNTQGEGTSELNEGARASLGLDDAPHITTTHSNNHDNEKQSPTDELLDSATRLKERLEGAQ
ncbi:hypothetical protein [Corynebacterium propinquum]|uniref:hypothetical protein n=1 Tax=Corynebacterium propinquum TaxID=43769 RepID=UPI0020C0C2CE|nr:hypothetical protein [Corynebacterium propinquum]UQV60363.1 hypothetical protein L9H28_00310 [Corynebacterium propinquum]